MEGPCASFRRSLFDRDSIHKECLLYVQTISGQEVLLIHVRACLRRQCWQKPKTRDVDEPWVMTALVKVTLRYVGRRYDGSQRDNYWSERRCLFCHNGKRYVITVSEVSTLKRADQTG
jgi:hypothetical protein